MKYFLLTAFFLAFVFVDTTAQKSSYTITGFIDSVADGTKINLILEGQEADSLFAIIKKGKFSFKGSVPEPTQAAIYIGNPKDSGWSDERLKGFWLENIPITFKAKNTNLNSGTIEGSLLDKESEIFSRDILQGHTPFDSSAQSRIIGFISANPRSYVALKYLQRMRLQFPVEILREMYNQFPSAQKNTSEGKKMQQYLSLKKSLKIGDAAADFTLPDMNGKMVSLSDYRGKYVLLDFWGSWCAPCRAKHPQLVKFHMEYSHKDFVMLGIGMDTKEALVKAIKQDGVTWTNLYTGKGYESQIAEQYGINAVPAMVLIDKQGKIMMRENFQILEVLGRYIIFDHSDMIMSKDSKVSGEGKRFYLDELFYDSTDKDSHKVKEPINVSYGPTLYVIEEDKMLTEKTWEIFKQTYFEQYPALFKKYHFSYQSKAVTFLFDEKGDSSLANDSTALFDGGIYSLNSIQLKYSVVHKLIDILGKNGNSTTPG